MTISASNTYVVCSQIYGIFLFVSKNTKSSQLKVFSRMNFYMPFCSKDNWIGIIKVLVKFPKYTEQKLFIFHQEPCFHRRYPNDMCCVARKPIFGVSDQARLYPAYLATETS